jgi:hydroxymethylbilane synthase
VTLRIGTRRSALAIAQAELVRSALVGSRVEAELVPMSTSGDRGDADPAASPQGLKGLWVDAISAALLQGEIDLAVHSAKDLPAADDDELVVAAVPRRADPRDVLVTRTANVELGPGTAVGTSSVRRAALLRAAHPGIEIRELRGNVDTRLRRLFEGAVQATVLAAAGLERLRVEVVHMRTLGPEEMIPAPGQGSLAVQCRAKDRSTRARLTLLDHAPSHQALDAERALVRRLGGGCALPLGALARERDHRIDLVAVVASPDGARLARAAVRASGPEAAAEAAERQLIEGGATEILAALA